MPSAPITLTLAHSPDPDDVFMWWPITGKIDPAEPSRIIEPPVLDTGRFRFRALPADIDVLNRRAIDVGDLEITAISMFAWAKVSDRYALTCCGSSMGEGYGPKVVTKTDSPLTMEDLASRSHPRVIAVPGTRTTAFLLLSMVLGPGSFRFVEMPFDQILEAVSSGRADAGLLIHQSQLTFSDLGLRPLIDLGAWWLQTTGLPLPLGGNAILRDLEDRHGGGTLKSLTSLLDRSIRYALANRDESTRYAMRFAPEISRTRADRYIDMYVSDLTVDAGERGQAAIQRLFAEGARHGLLDREIHAELLRP